MKPPMRRTMTLALLGLLSAPAPAFGAVPSQAHMVCAPRGNVAARLAERYSEVPGSRGVLRSGEVIEVFVSPAGSFTVIITRPDGVSCVLAAGEDWQELAPRPKGDAV